MTWATSVPILVFLGLSVLDLDPMYATDVRQRDVRQKHCLMPRLLGAGDNDPVNVRENDWRFVDKLCSTNMSVSVNYVITMSEFNE